MLIERGGDVKAATVAVKGFPSGVTALQMAAQNGHLEVVKLLIEQGTATNENHSSNGL